MNLEFRVSGGNTQPAYIRAASHCTVCNRVVDEVAVIDDPEGWQPTVVIKCHGETWKQRWPATMGLETIRVTVPIPTPALNPADSVSPSNLLDKDGPPETGTV